MQTLRGIVVSEGIARGPAVVIASGEINVREARVAEGQERKEVLKFERALQATRRDIQDLRDQTKAELGDISRIIDTYEAFLADETSVIGPIRRDILDDLWDAPSAVMRKFREMVEAFARMPEPLPSRIPDLMDIERRLIAQLLGQKGGAQLHNLPRHVIVIADDLTPSQTVSLDTRKVLGFATDRGGPASHTAIMARHLGIPAIVGLGKATRAVRQGDLVIIDGLNGLVCVNPDEDTVRRYQGRAKQLAARSRVQALKREPATTRDGFEVTILGNVDPTEGYSALRERGVAGVGLFRTEFLFLGKDVVPDEEAQVRSYRGLLEFMAPASVAIRTMDLGADKWDPRVGGSPEPNPFLGMRSIRLSFAYLDWFKTQLRAILRASAVGNARVMFPMITDVGEFLRARTILRSVMEDLRKEGIPFDESIPVGAMVEVPSAALGAHHLLEEADFLSLGTNDLTQYTLAVDRTNPRVADLFVPHHPGVLQLAKMAASAALSKKKPLTACGEMAGSPRHAPVLLGLGVTRLSMAPARVFDVVQRIRRLSLADCERLAEGLLNARDARESEDLLLDFEHELPRRARRRRP